MQFLKTTPELVAEYVKGYTGHPSNLTPANFDLPDGHKNAMRFKRDKNGKLVAHYPWLM